ncbi:MAG: AI-2E family transporter [Lachnospiraceae bacterium]
MQEKKKWSDNKYIVLLLITGAVYFFLRYISPLITPVVIAVMFLTLCYPTFDDIQKKTRIKKQYMASAIVFLVCGVLIVLVWLAGSFLIQNIPLWIEGMDDMQEGVQVLISESCREAGSFLGIDTDGLVQVIVDQVDVLVENFQVQVLPGLLGESWVYVKQLVSIIAVLAMTMIATILLAKDYDAILSRTGAQADSRMVLEVILKVIRYIATFLKAQLFIMVSIAVLCVVILLCAGVGNAFLFGILAGVMDALPFIGTGIVLLPLAIWQVMQGYYWKALFCVLAYILCVLLREFMEPKLIGKKVGVYPIAILIAIYAGIQLFGVWGIIKGPVGFVMIQQIYEVYCRYVDGRRQMNYDENVRRMDDSYDEE